MNWKTKLAYVLLLLVGTIFNGPFLTEAADCDSCISCFDKDRNCRQFYLGGIVGADFATLAKVPNASTAVPNQSLFTAGGTAGVRLLRDDGALRFEFEGRGRDLLSSTAPTVLGDVTTSGANGWSALVNVWRDYQVFQSLGIYGGGGLGSGGYRSVVNGVGITSNDNITNFAWQAGGGLIYNVSDRATLDFGYRFFAINDSSATLIALGTPFDYTTNFSASELLLTLRIYEPFRRWKR